MEKDDHARRARDLRDLIERHRRLYYEQSAPEISDAEYDALERELASLESAHPEIACLMLTSFADDEALFSAILAGASGYVLKQIKGSDLVNAVRRVAAGESLLDPSLTRQVMDRLRGEKVEDERLSRLTAQERNILELIAEGKTNRQIAEELFLAEKTVKNYVSNLLSKMGFARRTEAAVYAARLAERKHRN